MFGGIDFVFIAIGISIVARAVNGRRRYRDLPPPQQVMLEDPRVPQLQAELDELRSHVERMHATESFYAQLNAPAPQSAAAQPPAAAPPAQATAAEPPAPTPKAPQGS
ncbi:hypothetical protein [Longimicrobium sp.]|uniref:hypothetical protein n=1 Tax=Longimicrobium sp. TaxID=2029185 RepID=UPI002BD6C4A6|nr:hypothetical protein [Longimicrobium sp.]HSU15510.1 hypothetical protein [Longimicrobium sp.]